MTDSAAITYTRKSIDTAFYDVYVYPGTSGLIEDVVTKAVDVGHIGRLRDYPELRNRRRLSNERGRGSLL